MRIDITGQYGFSTLAIGVGEGGEAISLESETPGEGGTPTLRRLAAKIGGLGEGGIGLPKPAPMGATTSVSTPGEGGPPILVG